MSLNITPPNLPKAPEEYSPLYQGQFSNVLRLFFARLVNPGPLIASTQRVQATLTSPAQVVSALRCASVDPTGAQTISMPTQADFAQLRAGDIYYDTSGGAASSYPLRIKA
jgi:hypothetical protein